MLNRRVPINHARMKRATDLARKWNEEVVKSARALETDPERDSRREAQLCPCCFYVRSPRIGGAAITQQPCGLCESVETYASTATDVLCLECAKAHDLCKRCGADLELRPLRVLEIGHEGGDG